MTVQGRVAMVLLWIASLVVVGTIATQAGQPQRRDAAPIISGADLGFKPEGWQGKARTGTWMVRIDGEWVEAITGNKVSPATTR